MASTVLPKTFHILCGWAEGNWHKRQMVQALQSEGYTETIATDASVIIAHSAGVHRLPNAPANKLIVLIGVPYWPGKPVLQSLMQKMWHDITSENLLRLAKKYVRGTWYIIKQPVLNIKTLHGVFGVGIAAKIPTKAVIVRNQHDPFCTPNIPQLLPNDIIMLPGFHDDCWPNPIPYVGIIKDCYAKLLA